MKHDGDEKGEKVDDGKDFEVKDGVEGKGRVDLAEDLMGDPGLVEGG